MRESNFTFKPLLLKACEKVYIWSLKAVILGKLINLAVGRIRRLEARKYQFVRDMQSLEGIQKGTCSSKMLEELSFPWGKLNALILQRKKTQQIRTWR